MTEVVFIGVVLYLLLSGGSAKAEPKRVISTGELPDEPEPAEPTPVEIWRSHVADTPTVGKGYQMRYGVKLFGNDGVIVRALRAYFDREPTVPERMQYYAAICRVRSNWRLYGTLAGATTPNVEQVTVRGPQGDQEGTITAAQCPTNDSWEAALQAGELPNRLIGWTRKPPGATPCSTVRQDNEWQSNLHGPTRRYGCLFLPPWEATDAGIDVTSDPAFDWPAEVYESVGETWGAWVP